MKASKQTTKPHEQGGSTTPKNKSEADRHGEVQRASRAPGQPLPSALRTSMEQRLGRNFGDVRVHTDPQAAASARQLEARAYTVGSHIVFGKDRFSPGTPQGRQLLIHELSHVAQQQRSDTSSAASPARAEAEAQANAQGTTAQVTANVAAGSLQRDPLTKAEIEQLDEEQIKARIAANEEEAQMMIFGQEYYDQLEEERNALLAALNGETKIPVPPFPEGKPPDPPRAKKAPPSYPAAADAFKGIEMYAFVMDNLPEATNANFYRKTKNFNIGINMRRTESGFESVFYLASVNWPGMKGPQWVIGPDSIDTFVKNDEAFAQRTMFSPADPDTLSDWQLEVFKAQQSMMQGRWKDALKHIGRSHAEKWSDEPVESVLELMPMPGPKGTPKPRPPRVRPPRVPKVRPPKPRIPKVAPKAAPKVAPKTTPKVAPKPKPKAAPKPKPTTTAKPKAAPKPKATATPKAAPKPKAPAKAKPPAAKKPKAAAPAKKKAAKPKTTRKRNQYPDFEDIPDSMKKVAKEQTEQLSKQLGIKIPKDRVLSAPWVGRIRNAAGKARSASTSQGWLRNESKFWSKWKKAFPDDAKLLGKGNTVTKELAEKYGWPTTGKNSVVGQKLVHHHMSNGSFTVAIPESLHVKLSGAIHAKPTVIP